MSVLETNENPQNLRVIKTARDLDSINKAVKNGYKPLIRKVEPSGEIRSKYAVIQNKKTGEVEVISDYRMGFQMLDESEYQTLIDWSYYYPYNFSSPFATYLIPNDIENGERVFIEDLIEDFIGLSWGQGDTYRLDSCEAIWNGSDLEIKYDPDVNRSLMIG